MKGPCDYAGGLFRLNPMHVIVKADEDDHQFFAFSARGAHPESLIGAHVVAERRHKGVTGRIIEPDGDLFRVRQDDGAVFLFGADDLSVRMLDGMQEAA